MFDLGKKTAAELVERFLHHPKLEMHPLKCMAILAECMESSDRDVLKPEGLSDCGGFKSALHSRMDEVIERNPENWGGYTCRPSVFISSPDSPLFEPNKEWIRKEIQYLADTRNQEGIWELTWTWASFEREFAISQNWWKAELATNNMRVIRAFS